ncbi:MAG TPA: DUF2202 domain-containing protein [Vicinamibacteria bacterium]|nr:DUF2202 domain-containing protein [Vicinamibacteria bacterium]
MKITPTKTLPAAALAGLLVLAPAASGRGTERSEPLSGSVKAAVEEALLDELRGEAMYSRVLKDHGDVRPFSNVVRAERRHAAFLEDLLKARGLAAPAPQAGAEVLGYASVKEACIAAVAFETTNVALYDRLLAAGPLPDDAKRAFDHNRMASLDHHKPAFERCAGVATTQGAGRCAGHGAGHGTGQGAACGDGHGCGHGCGHRGHGHGQGHGGPGCGQP